MTTRTDSDELRNIEFLPHDGPLRDDVRRLGAQVGRMLAEQGGEPFLERVENVRTAAISRREAGNDVQTLAGKLSGLDVAESESLARAFAAYFHAVNIAERVHRIRRRRDYQRDADAPSQPESLADVLEKLKAQGVSADELLQWIDRLDVEPVFTAHPTEAVRRSLLEKEQEIVRALVADFDASLPPAERAVDLARMRMAMTASWQTAEASRVKPSVQDEFEHVTFYLSDPIYRVLPAFYESFQHELKRVYGIEQPLPRVLRFASWVGGDMDGNPNVGADTITETLRAQRAQVLERYIDDCAHLGRLLSQTDDRINVDAALRERLAHYREQFPEADAQIRPRHRDMPYRCLLTLMKARLEATLDDADTGYASVDGFAEDLGLIAASLRANKGEHAGLFAVERLQQRVRSFAFHLARLDVRQDSRVHADALAALLGDEGWAEREVGEQVATLRDYAKGDKALAAGEDETATRLRDVFTAMAAGRERYGAEALGLYIISMAESAADVLAVLALARHGGLTEPADAGGDRVPLDIAPLFETVDDLTHGPDTLRALLEDPVYRAHLKQRGDRQFIMLGYSDSGKDGGILAARWGLQRAQVELLKVAREAGIEVVFFHGRGGSASRGGSRVTPALMSSPRGSVAGRLRVTEQGEVIHRRYGIRALGVRHLEQTVGAVLRASLRPREPDTREDDWRARMSQLAAYSRETYRDFVTDPNFVQYFRTATPIDVIEHMTLGSRPSRRRSMRGVEDLRAIPWVFSWTQCRSIMPGWYGVGSALERGAEEFGEDALAEMARDWPFLATLLNDVEMVLAKVDLDIAETFSRLSGDLHGHFFPKIREEFERTVKWVLRLKGQDRLLTDDRRLELSIRLRNPYIDPMSVLQVNLLERWRQGGSDDAQLLRALVACVNGVSQGLQNTG
ncbi:phosphoenolpyruvate carboxylase [Oleiagrimonas sp. C23AA]|uniref:phosphoenolpyruvate carboxylase n=1 Tax=Oleiagrimonas sp. C23AA TaxID=2719047 RepID=UPI0014223626|nr:phosphoenolpyruvate carboxylase [Oleiagrimonas sp. C23AA]NII09858.1 phosphoenolpyruvate carboxylase [Oleiagrimonas sp. C23AA]